MNTRTEELLGECEKLHGHICPGQILGVRMALLGCELIGVEDPRGRGRKKIIVWVEIDRCLTDAVSAVTGVRLGKRSLKFLDYGKVAATFLNTENEHAVRIVARDESRLLADEQFPEVESRKERQMRFYREAKIEELFKIERVRVLLDDLDRPGHTRTRVVCAGCGEGVNNGREVTSADGVNLCQSCAGGAYYEKVV
jgi:formylmethanofuran dehydrogenase subunit E